MERFLLTKNKVVDSGKGYGEPENVEEKYDALEDAQTKFNAFAKEQLSDPNVILFDVTLLDRDTSVGSPAFVSNLRYQRTFIGGVPQA